MFGAAIAALSVSVSVCCGLPSVARAESLEVLLPYVIENHDRVRAEKARLTAARNRAREALGKWYPTLGQTANFGHERQQNDAIDDTSTGFNEWDVSLTQLLWDFGSTNSAIDKARLQVEKARYDLISARQALILEAISAYMNVIRSHTALGFANDSEDNIRRQTGLEEAMVDLGSGFSTDVLQAKTQLAGAQARLAQSDGGLINALNRYKAVFGRTPDNIDALEPVPYPASYLPHSLTQAVDVALEVNPALKNAILAADIAKEDVRIANADNFFPKIEASGERKFKKNVGGTIGSEQETLAKVEMTFDFNLGFTAVNTLRAAKSDLSATTFTAADTRRNIEEQVRNAWQQLDTATRTASHLGNQANIAAAFLELARNERQLGRRSLIDVLSGETNLINSKSDALSAETDVLIAAYGLLAATGQLEYDVIKGSRGVKPPSLSPTPRSGRPAVQPAPTTPVAPVDPAQQGRIEADTNVAAGRSVHDLQILFAAANAAPQRGPSPPAFPPKIVLETPITPSAFEFASTAPSTGYQAVSDETLPAYSDTSLSSTPAVIAISPLDQVSIDAAPAAAAVMAPEIRRSGPVDAEVAALSMAEREAAPVPDRNPFVHLFADIGNILQSADIEITPAVGPPAPPASVTAQPDAPHDNERAAVPVASTSESMPSAPTPASEMPTPGNPFVHLFTDLGSLFNAPPANSVMAAERAAAPIPEPALSDGDASAAPQTPRAIVESARQPEASEAAVSVQQESGSNDVVSDLFSFFKKAAQNRELADIRAHKPTESAGPPASLTPVEDALKNKPHQERPDLLIAISSLFEASGKTSPSNQNITGSDRGNTAPAVIKDEIRADIEALGR